MVTVRTEPIPTPPPSAIIISVDDATARAIRLAIHTVVGNNAAYTLNANGKKLLTEVADALGSNALYYDTGGIAEHSNPNRRV